VLSQNIKILSFEPHLHAPGKRMCLEAIWGYNIQTLNCVGYDHNWVRATLHDESAPLLPKAPSCTSSVHGQLAVEQERAGSAQLAGLGQSFGGNMFIDLGARVSLTDDQFKEEMTKRRAQNPGKTSSSAVRCASASSRRRRLRIHSRDGTTRSRG
jgi:hypothetical protein